MDALKELSRYERDVLPNGTILLVRRETETPYVTFAARIGYGHCHDPLELDGAAHLTEHTFFRGNHKYSKEEIGHELQWLTGMDPNASTSQEEILLVPGDGPYIVPPENLEKFMDVIASALYNQRLKPEEVEKERLAVLNELRDLGHFQKYSREVLQRELYPDRPYGSRFGSNVQTISAITAEQLDRIRDVYFTGPNLIVVLAGYINNQHIKTAEQLFGVGSAEKVPELPEVKPMDNDAFLKQRFTDVPGNKPQISVYRTFQLKPSREGIALDILADYLGSGMNSILSRRLREQLGIVYGAGANGFSRDKISGFVVSAVGFEEDKLDIINNVLEEEVEKVKQSEIDRDFLELRKHMRVLSYPRGFNTAESRANWMLDREVRGLPFDHQEYVDVVKSVTPEDLVTGAQKYLNGHKLTFVALLTQ